MRKEHKLCYVEEDTAYFTDRSLDEQWGDDWNDVPYEHNAGKPYSDNGEDIVAVKFEANLQTPADKHYTNSPYSVKTINDGAIPWLQTPEYMVDTIKIWAGCSIEDFKELVRRSGGQIYVLEGES